MPIQINHPYLWLNSGYDCVPSPSVSGKRTFFFTTSSDVEAKSQVGESTHMVVVVYDEGILYLEGTWNI